MSGVVTMDIKSNLEQDTAAYTGLNSGSRFFLHPPKLIESVHDVRQAKNYSRSILMFFALEMHSHDTMW